MSIAQDVARLEQRPKPTAAQYAALRRVVFATAPELLAVIFGDVDNTKGTP